MQGHLVQIGSCSTRATASGRAVCGPIAVVAMTDGTLWQSRFDDSVEWAKSVTGRLAGSLGRDGTLHIGGGLRNRIEVRPG
jgi:hypothetical protein